MKRSSRNTIVSLLLALIGLAVCPPASAQSLTSVTINATSVTGGVSPTGTVNLSGPATSNVTVSLSSSSSSANVPATTNVPIGMTSAAFLINTALVTNTTSVIITASANGVTQTATLTLQPTNVHYTMIDIGYLSSDNQVIGPFGMNNKGEIVGRAWHDPDGYHAFYYTGGVLYDLGQGRSNAINDASEIVGGAGGDAFLDVNLTLINLGMLSSYSGGDCEGYAINNFGQIAGFGTDSNGYNRAWLYVLGSGFEEIGSLGGNQSGAYGINNNGEIVGFSEIISGSSQQHPFLYSNGVMNDLGVLPGFTDGVAYGINDAGDVVGVCFIPNTATSHGFLWQNGVMTDLGTLGGGFAYGVSINNAGDVVGYSTTNPNDTSSGHAFLIHNGEIVDLNALVPPNSGWTLTLAQAINDKGEIACQGVNGTTQNGNLVTHTFLLIPNGPLPPPSVHHGPSLPPPFGGIPSH